MRLKLDLDEKQEKLMNKFQKQIKTLKRFQSNNNLLFDWFRVSSEMKIQVVKEFIENFLEKNEKFVCFGHHKVMLDAIEELLVQKQVNFIRIDGSTSPAARQQLCNDFQLRNDFVVALLSITAAGVGINLTAAATVIFAEIYWNPGIIVQAEDRVHRIGQEDVVRIIYLVAKGSIDDQIWPLITKKLEILNKAGLSKRDDLNETQALVNVDDDQELITEFFEAIQNGKVQLENDF